MNSRVPWSVEGIDPSVRERAEAAARRAGMSLSDWLNSTIGDSAPPSFRPALSKEEAVRCARMGVASGRAALILFCHPERSERQRAESKGC